MEKRFGIFIVAGLLIGGVLGLLWGPAIGNPTLGIVLGALGGVFIGWFIAAADRQNHTAKQDK